jgi:endonuclease/exonuclease/phosphatase family metal-dependent hydrolase
MSLKLLQLNIFQGKFLPLIIDYVKQHDFDILHFQEVSGGSFSKGGLWSGPREQLTTANPEMVGIDCFATIKKELRYEGILNTTVAKRADHTSYFGNATFFKPKLTLVATKETFLKPYLEKGEEFIPPQQMPRAVLTTVFSCGGKEISFLNCHLAWGPHSNDEPHKLEQGEKLVAYVKSLTTPFILTGDFNVDSKSQIVTWLETVGKNLVVENNITNTLNPNVHAAKQLFPPGLGVDFTFVSKDITVTDFQLVDTPNLSDHLGLSLTIDL